MSADEREEGEIVDDDFEAVSDCPMDICSPAPPPPPDISDLLNIPVLTLSNVTDDSSQPPTPKNHKRRRRKRKSDPKITHRKRPSSSESECEWVEPKFARQLHKALKHETPTNILHRSLRSRLKPLMKKDEHGSKDEGEELRDMELIELRMAALKSVVLTNHERQKRRADGSSGKENSMGNNGEGAKGEIELDKENNLSVINGGKRVRRDSGPKSIPEAAINGNIVE